MKEVEKQSVDLSTATDPSGNELVLPGDIKGKAIETMEVYQMEGAICLDLHFVDSTVLELIYRVGFTGSATLLASRDGNYEVLKRSRTGQVAQS